MIFPENRFSLFPIMLWRLPPKRDRHHSATRVCASDRDDDDLHGRSVFGRVQTAGLGNPAIAQAARSVLTSRQATVIWPTPPGTGVIAPATAAASSKATSPTRRVLPSAPGNRLMPTSITVAPGLIQPPRTISGLPTAA